MQCNPDPECDCTLRQVAGKTPMQHGQELFDNERQCMCTCNVGEVSCDGNCQPRNCSYRGIMSIFHGDSLIVNGWKKCSCDDGTVKCDYQSSKKVHETGKMKFFKGVLHPRPILRLFLHFSQKLQHIGNK